MLLSCDQLAYMALRDLGCLRPGQTASSDMLADILAAANNLVDAWLIDRFMVPFYDVPVYTLTSGGQFYLIGPGAIDTVIDGVQYYGLDAPRPTGIERANCILNTYVPSVHRPIEVITVDDWAAIRVPQIPVAIPLRLYYDKSYSVAGWARIWLWPGPLDNYQLELFTWSQFTGFADGVTSYNFYPGYPRCLQKNLAMEIAPLAEIYAKLGRLKNPRADRLELVARQAAEAKSVLQQYNSPDPTSHCDPAFSSALRRRGSFNYAIGE